MIDGVKGLNDIDFFVIFGVFGLFCFIRSFIRSFLIY